MNMSLIYVGLVILLSAILARFLVTWRHSLYVGECLTRVEVKERNASHAAYLMSSEVNGACYFASGYDDAVKDFLRLAEQAKAEVFPMKVRDQLANHVAIFRGDPDHFLIHISGTHGVEAYAGTAVQSAALEYLIASGLYQDEERAVLPTLVFVHVLNPYGFKFSRRVNEDNIDLNRNFLTGEEFDFVRSRDPNYAQYVDLYDLLNPTKKISSSIVVNEITSFLSTLANVALHGLLKLKRALVSGNYHFKEGLGFGGFEQAQSTKNLIHLVTERLNIPQIAKSVVLIDVHTGLGPAGVDTLMYSASKEFEDAKRMDQIFPTEYGRAGKAEGGIKVLETFTPLINGACAGDADRKECASAQTAHATNGDAMAVATGYDLTVGTITKGFCSNFLAPKDREMEYICITEEFGTVAPIQVGKFLMEENYARHHGSQKEVDFYSDQLKKCFFVNTGDWKNRIVRRGMKVFVQGLNYLRSKSEEAAAGGSK